MSMSLLLLEDVGRGMGQWGWGNCYGKAVHYMERMWAVVTEGQQLWWWEDVEGLF